MLSSPYNLASKAANFSASTLVESITRDAVGLKPSTSFTFNVWINSAKPYINYSIKDGESTRKDVEITIDVYSIYKELGECNYTIYRTDGKVFEDVKINQELINSLTVEGKINNLKITVSSEGSYITKLHNSSGNTFDVYNFTKKRPLNVTAIILIVIGVLAVAAVVIVIVKMRKKMTIR